MMSHRWGYIIILVVFIAISWGVRMLLSQNVSDKVLDDKEEDE
ncbi:MAG: hypothetical protein SCK29_01415 [Bacillota bacterium]|nr:hypothetical protein [Bacillota bacterium]MDW7682758.1 hypothetical protein [Bacillota bacterium]